MDPREWLFDKRVVRRNLDKGVLGLKVYNDYLKSLDDCDDEYEMIELDSRSEEADESEDDEGEDDEEDE